MPQYAVVSDLHHKLVPNSPGIGVELSWNWCRTLLELVPNSPGIGAELSWKTSLELSSNNNVMIYTSFDTPIATVIVALQLGDRQTPKKGFI